MKLLKKEFKTMTSAEVAKVMISDILDSGQVDLSDIVMLRKMKEAIDKALRDKGVKQFVDTQHALHGEKSVSLDGANLQRRNTTKHKYDDCGHTSYNSIVELLKKAENIKKDFESEMKLIDVEKEIYMTSTYEITEVPCGELATVKETNKVFTSTIAFSV